MSMLAPERRADCPENLFAGNGVAHLIRFACPGELGEDLPVVGTFAETFLGLGDRTRGGLTMLCARGALTPHPPCTRGGVDAGVDSRLKAVNLERARSSPGGGRRKGCHHRKHEE